MADWRKTRLHPAHLQMADELREPYHYHQPDGPLPSRQLIVEISLRKGLRALEYMLLQHRLHEPTLPAVPSKDWPRVRIDTRLLTFADQMRGPYYELQRSDEDHTGAYPSRCMILNAALDLGLSQTAQTYTLPKIASK